MGDGEERDRPARDAAEIKSRATAGAALVVGRGFLIRFIGLAGNVVLARLLTPADFGVVALGGTLLTFASLVSEGGIAAGFVRGPTEPSRRDLEAAVAFQFHISLLIVLLAAVPCLLLGRTGLAALIMLASLPLLAFRTPGAVLFERHLHFRPQIKIELAETLVYTGFAITAVVFGAGVWGLVAAFVVRAAAGSALMMLIAPVGFVAPLWHSAELRRMLSFGAQFQGISASTLARDQGLNMATAALGGLTTLGLWSLLTRLLQIPLLVLSSLRRVSYPGIARLMATGEDIRPVMRRTMALSCVMSGAMAVGLVGTGPVLIPTLFGPQWDALIDVLPLAGGATLINGPVSVAVLSFLLAGGAVSVALRSAICQAVAGLLTAIALLPVLDLTALGVSLLVMSIVDALILGVAAYRRIQVNLLPLLALYIAVAATAAGCGWIIAIQELPQGVALVLSALGAEVVYGSLLYVFTRSDLTDAGRLGARSVRLALGSGQL
jgi:O-antigen/teichoic acid export membrane protein